ADIASFSAILERSFTGSVSEQHHHDGQALPDDYVHFGYKDSISQPTVLGMEPTDPDDQPGVEPHYFIVMDSHRAPYSVPTPAKFWINGSFGAFRILEQDVAGFVDYLKQQKVRHGIDEE